MKRATDVDRDATGSSPLPVRDRFVRTLGFLALGPVLLLATPVEPGTASLLASLVLAGSFLAARVLPRRLAARLGRPGAFFAASLLLGGVGTLLGVLDGCGLDAASCRYAIGAWTLTWLLLPSFVWGVTAAARVFVAAPRAAMRLLSKVRRASFARR